jgi:hypothetical protein
MVGFQFSLKGVSEAITMFVSLISHQAAVLFSHNKPAISNQPAVLFYQNKPAPTISTGQTNRLNASENCAP